MSNYQIGTIIISVLSVLISVIALMKARKANALSLEANTLSIEANTLSKNSNSTFMGQAETNINQSITNTKQQVGALTTQMVLAGNLTQEQSSIIEQSIKTAIENNLNAYEDACSKYRDNKIDKIRFKKTYKTEIRQLVESPEHKEYFFPAETSRYKVILKVYNEWEDLED